ncbi:MAG: hypothetical protein LBE81_03495 [Azonexus sp.]|jgi:hypothetical protein|uniref:hypothetical protein n=1 Tax=Azonexus sp. TaxID=1872668 RepID=UPI002825EF64|nr:hypothetical protein [Azonexus sp.]MDR0775688.1 hypothetical protein [Azonexus sp.]
MTLTRRDLDKLLWPLLGGLALLLLAAGSAWWSYGDWQGAQRERDAAATRKQRIEQHLGQARGEEQELKERARLFQELQQSGIAGPERRLEWIELLRDLQHRLRIPGLNYEFGPRQPLYQNGSDFVYFASPVRLQLRLVHEEDLLRILASLQSEAKALVLIRQCTLAPLDNRGAGNDLAQLSAECELSWVTIDRP